MSGWHENPENWDGENWHGPIDRTEILGVWDLTSQEMVEKTVDYRLCGCIIYRDA